MTRLVRRYLAAVFLSASLLLGGASAAGIVANVALQLLALVVIVIVLLSGAMPSPTGAGRTLSWLFGLAAAVMLAQLIPLPPAVWESLPGRAEVRTGFALADVSVPWLPISLSPDDSIAALLAMLPPAAMLVAIFASSPRGRAHAVHVMLLIVLVSLGLGAIQVAGGAESGGYLYATTNLGSAVGFFANRNHFATLLLIALPFVMALARAPGPAWSGAARLAWRWGACGTFIAIVVGIAAVRSVAGLLLAVPVVAACVPIGLRDRWTRPRARRAGIVGGMVLGAIVLAAVLGHAGHPVGDSDPQHRAVLTATTLRAAFDYRPFGAGGGSFDLIYPAYEDPAAASLEYINHAHDDYAEAVLDYGLPGALLIVAAIGMWIVRAGAVWRGDGAGGDYARAGWVACGVVIAHSAVDYPLRTAAIATVAAMAAALAASPDPASERQTASRWTQRTESSRLSVSIDDF